MKQSRRVRCYLCKQLFATDLIQHFSKYNSLCCGSSARIYFIHLEKQTSNDYTLHTPVALIFPRKTYVYFIKGTAWAKLQTHSSNMLYVTRMCRSMMEQEQNFNVLNAQIMEMNSINFTFLTYESFLNISFKNSVFQNISFEYISNSWIERSSKHLRNLLENKQKGIKKRVEVCALEEEKRCHAIFYLIGNICYKIVDSSSKLLYHTHLSSNFYTYATKCSSFCAHHEWVKLQFPNKEMKTIPFFLLR